VVFPIHVLYKLVYVNTKCVGGFGSMCFKGLNRVVFVHPSRFVLSFYLIIIKII
jgi:hypothetical protein